MRGERMFEVNYVCMYDLLSFIPSLDDPTKTVKQDTLEFTAASVAPGADGRFALTVPDDTPPSVAGRRCALTWRVRARTSEYPQSSDARHTLEIACPS